MPAMVDTAQYPAILLASHLLHTQTAMIRCATDVHVGVECRELQGQLGEADAQVKVSPRPTSTPGTLLFSDWVN